MSLLPHWSNTMSTQTPLPLPFDLLRTIDTACDAFDEAWRSGQRPEIDHFLPRVEEQARPLLLAELIRIDLERRCRRGEQLGTGEYVQRYPACRGEIDSWLDEAMAATRSFPAITPAPGDSPTANADPWRTVPNQGAKPGPAFGQVLGEYDLLERIGAGGMGEVWKARHRKLNKLVALKQLLPGARLPDPETRARFLQEILAVGRLDHPNLIEAHDAGEQDGMVYLVMKLVEGQDLARLVKERGPLPVSEACALMRQTALGLHYLHELGLVHRDLKPSNLMRTPEETVKILDFGLARLRRGSTAEALTPDGRVMGTPDFMAPEQAKDSARADIRADIYSLGCTLYFLLTAQPPFPGGSLTEKLLNHQQTEPTPVNALRKDLPAGLQAILARMMAKRPEDRYQTPSEVADALAVFITGTTKMIPPPLPPRPHTGHGWVRRVLGVAGAACLMAIVGVILSRGLWKTPVLQSELKTQTEVTPPAKLPLEVFRWEAEYVERVGEVGKTRGLLGVSAFQPKLGDRLGWIEAELSEPAHAYLIAYLPNGKEELCWPSDEDQAPPLENKPRYPRPGKEVEYELNDGTGLQVFVLAVARKPLPAYRDWLKQNGQAPWKGEKLPEEQAGVVWRDRGLGLDGWTLRNPFRAGGLPATRGKDAEKLGVGPLVRLTGWWRDQKGIEVVALLGMSVEPR
jgi:serine/threonine protein kinase